MGLTIPTGWGQTSRLFTSMVEDLNSGLPGTNPPTLSVAVREAIGLRAFELQVQHCNRSQAHCLLLLLIQGWFSHLRLADQPPTKNLLFPVIL